LATISTTSAIVASAPLRAQNCSRAPSFSVAEMIERNRLRWRDSRVSTMVAMKVFTDGA